MENSLGDNVCYSLKVGYITCKTPPLWIEFPNVVEKYSGERRVL